MTDETGFKKKLTAPIWGKEAEIGPETRSFALFSS